MGNEVDEYIEKQRSPHKEILKEVRKIFQKTLQNFEEQKAWGVVAFGGGKFYIAAMKDRVHVGFAINGLSEEEIGFFEGSGKTMRHIKIKSLEDVNEKQLIKLIKMVNEKANCISF